MDIKQHLNPRPAELQTFGLQMSIVILVIFALILPFFGHNRITSVYWICGVGIVVSYAYPKTLKLLYIPWMIFAEVLGSINSKVILFLTYFFIFLPIGSALKLLNKKMLNTDFKTVNTYRNTEHQNSSFEHIY